MRDLSLAYAKVQVLKGEPWEPPVELVETISASYREEFGRSISSSELKFAVAGVGWIARMADEQGLDLDEIMGIAEHLGYETRTNLSRSESSSDRLMVGIGAGFFTGLWVGILLDAD